MTTISLDQVLHGYAHGHRRLAGSVTLSMDAERSLLFLSDLSGAGRVPEFDSYLTGYALASASVFAFARTWYAEEMPRPGCVWTHTLLIPFAELARIPDLRILLDIFRRPILNDDLLAYSEPLTLTVDSRHAAAAWRRMDLDRIVRTTAIAALNALYSTPERHLVVPASEGAAFEELTLLVWSQQWPRLRREFRFCTGALGPRAIPVEGFDLQIVPESRTFAFRDIPDHLVLSPPFEHLLEDISAHWSRLLWADLCGPPTELRRYLWANGADVSGGRGGMRSLCTVLLKAGEKPEGGHDLASLLDEIAAVFPSPDEAGRLKRALFGGPAVRRDAGFVQASDSTVLQALTTAVAGSAIAPGTLDLDTRCGTLLVEDPAAARILFLSALEARTDIGRCIVTAMVDRMPASMLAEVLSAHPALAASLIKLRPDAVHEPAFWWVSEDLRRTLVEVSFRAASTSGERAQLVRTVLNAGLFELPPGTTRQLGAIGATALLDWLQANSGNSLPALGTGWTELLRAHPRRVTDWLTRVALPATSVCSVLPDILDPTRIYRDDNASVAWLGLIRASARRGETHTNAFVRSCAFGFALSKLDQSHDGAVLMATVFPSLHRALAANSYDHRTWTLIESYLPHLGFLWDWDRCERLRRAFIESYVENDWPPEYFLAAAQAASVRPALEALLGEVRNGKAFRKRVRAAVTEARDAAKVLSLTER